MLARVRQLPPAAGWGVLVAFAAAAALALLQVRSVASAGYDIQRLEAERDAARQSLYRLEYEVAELESLGRVEREATQRMKMVKPATHLWVTVDRSPASTNAPVRPSTASVDGRESEPAFLAWIASLGDKPPVRP